MREGRPIWIDDSNNRSIKKLCKSVRVRKEGRNGMVGISGKERKFHKRYCVVETNNCGKRNKKTTKPWRDEMGKGKSLVGLKKQRRTGVMGGERVCEKQKNGREKD